MPVQVLIALLRLPSPGMSDENAPLISNNAGTGHGTFTADNPAVPPLEQSLDEDSTPATPQRSLLAIVRVFRFSIIKTTNSMVLKIIPMSLGTFLVAMDSTIVVACRSCRYSTASSLEC